MKRVFKLFIFIKINKFICLSEILNNVKKLMVLNLPFIKNNVSLGFNLIFESYIINRWQQGNNLIQFSNL